MAEHKVDVKREGNKLVCDPPETHARRGDVIVWDGPAGGPAHTGRFLGRVKEIGGGPPKRHGFTREDLHPDKLEAQHHPGAARNWGNRQRVSIRNDAVNGAYAYVVEVLVGPGPNDKIDSDPVVIIED